MCLGAISLVVETWVDGGTRTGRLDDGAIVSLAFVPDAREGDHVLVHLGIPVERLERADAEAALALRRDAG